MNTERIGILLGSVLVMMVLFAGCSTADTPEPITGSVTIAEVKDEAELQSVTLSFGEVKALSSVTGHGNCVSTVGIRYGPWMCTGVPLPTLADLVGGLGPNDTVWVSAPDGYLWVFDEEQVRGEDFFTFNNDLQEIPSPPLTVILAYEFDDRPLTYDEGAPFRIAIISEEPGVITEGSSWVKWVDRIEVHRR